MENPTLTLTADGVAYSVTFDRFDAYDRRPGYRWTIGEAPQGNHHPAPVATGDDLRGASYAEPNLADALASLLRFLAAHVESVEHAERTGRPAENVDLFPPSVTATLALDADALAMLAAELRPED